MSDDLQALKWVTVQRKVADLIPCDFNPRNITESGKAKMKESLEEFDLVEIPVIDFDEIIIAGHQRIQALFVLDRGEEIIDVRFPNRKLTENEFKKYLLLSNNHFGEFDFSEVGEYFQDFDFEAEGLKIKEFDDYLLQKQAEMLPMEDDENNLPEVNQTDIVLGDLFQIGEHRLLCGDSTQTDSFAVLFEDKMADLVVTDPPYNVALGMETKEEAKRRNRRIDGLVIENDKMDNDSFYQFLYDFYTAIGSFSKKGCAIYVWYASSEVVNFVSALKNAGWLYKQELIWNKNSLIMGRQDYQWKHEPCLYGWKEGASHNWFSDRKQTTILDFNKPSKNTEHPTMKPVELISYQIINSSKPKEIVADGFGGSGTTMIASHKLDRVCYMVEFDPKYCDVIVRRMIKMDPTLSIKRNGIDETEKWLDKLKNA